MPLDIQPAAPAPEQPVVVPAEGAPAPAAAASALPQEILQVPAFQAIFAGSPPAVSASLQEMNKSPEAEALRKHKDLIFKAGMGLYRSLSGDIGVLFNRFYISPEQLQQADKEGTLQQIAPSLAEVNQSVASSGDAHPALTHSGEVPQAFASAPAPVLPTSAQQPQPPASVKTKMTTARAKNSTPGAPSSGPRPGGGRVMNEMMKNVV